MPDHKTPIIRPEVTKEFGLWMLAQCQWSKLRHMVRRENMAIANHVDEEGKTAYQVNYQGFIHMAIINFEEENPMRIGVLNGVLDVDDPIMEIGVVREQKGNQTCTTYNRQPMISKERSHPGLSN